MNILLVGNPNTGKTTLFNALTHSSEKVGNWNGVTNQYKVGSMGEHNVVDLPGTYSLTPLTFEEKVTVDFLYHDHKKSLCVNVCEIDSLSKNFFLSLELLEYGAPMVMVINNKNHSKFTKVNTKKLEQKLGIKVFLVDFENKQQMHEFATFLQTHKPDFSAFEPHYLNEVLKPFALQSPNKLFSARYFLTKALEQDEYFLNQSSVKLPDKLEQICLTRHHFIASMGCHEKVATNNTHKIDNILLGKWTALPIFFAIMLAIFYLTFFSLGRFLSDGLEKWVTQSVAKGFSSLLLSFTDNAFLLGFFEKGVFGGLAILLRFLPQVVLLFLFMHLVEQSGYLSRVAFLFDDILTRFGLSGRSVYTILMGFGCSASAIMTSRTVATKEAKIKTALLTPYMSCSAKIPVYAVLGGVLFGASNVFVVMFLYVFGLVVGFLLCLFFEKTFLKTTHSFSLLEFTPLAFDKAKTIVKNVFQSTKEFFARIFVLLLCTNIIVWFLSSFSFGLVFVQTGEGSILQSISGSLAPLFSPLGFSSFALVAALICGLVAKEIVLSTLALFATMEGLTLSAALGTVSSAIFLTPAAGFAFLTFVLLYPACFATMGMLKQEVGIKWATIGLLLQLVLAYLLSFVAYQIFCLATVAWLELLLLLFALILMFFLLKKAFFSPCKGCKKRPA